MPAKNNSNIKNAKLTVWVGLALPVKATLDFSNIRSISTAAGVMRALNANSRIRIEENIKQPGTSICHPLEIDSESSLAKFEAMLLRTDRKNIFSKENPDFHSIYYENFACGRTGMIVRMSHDDLMEACMQTIETNAHVDCTLESIPPDLVSAEVLQNVRELLNASAFLKTLEIMVNHPNFFAILASLSDEKTEVLQRLHAATVAALNL